jgi:dTDP-4-amino-4,6-dideoxygalactose transaminase
MKSTGAGELQVPQIRKMLQVPLIDLATQVASLRGEIMDALARIVDSQKFILGEEVQSLEVQLATYSGARFAIGCGSGSDALLLALLALDIGPGDEVLTVPFTFFATAGSISRAGARPVFCDVDKATFNIDVAQAASVIDKRPRIKAILPVHLFGGCADMDPLREIARARGIHLIEDAAQAIGAEYKGRRAGSLGDVGCFSFYPTKNLGAFGDGGLCTTDDERLAERLRALRVHGRTGTYYHEWIGVASRLDAMQAAILSVKLQHLDDWSDHRGRNAHLYTELFAQHQIAVTLPQPAAYQNRHIFHQFVIRCAERDRLQEYLKSRAIGTEIYYPLALHQQPCFADLGYSAGDFPVSEELAGTVLALPIHSDLEREQIEYVVESIARFYKSS